jgi:hypothetical protein
MKPIYVLFIGILWALSVNAGIAQTVASNDLFEEVEREYKGETYIIHRPSQNTLRASGNNQTNIGTVIANKDRGELKGHSAAGGCYGLKETIPFEDIIKEALSKEKIKLLALNAENVILIKCDYNIKTGKVIHVQFLLRTPLSKDTDSETEISLKDINKIESLFKEYYFDVPEDCVNREGGNYGNWARGVRFSKLEEEEKWTLSVNTGIAQTATSNDLSEKVEKEYKGETYIIDRPSQTTLRASGNNQTNISTFIENKDRGELEGHSAAGGCYYLKESAPLDEVIKKAISKKKIESLALNKKNKIVIKFDYNIKTGKIVHLLFIFNSAMRLSDDMDSETEITLKDIHTLESLFKEYYFDVPEDCVNRETGNIYGGWTRFFWFYKLTEEEKKE